MPGSILAAVACALEPLLDFVQCSKCRPHSTQRKKKGAFPRREGKAPYATRRGEVPNDRVLSLSQPRDCCNCEESIRGCNNCNLGETCARPAGRAAGEEGPDFP